MPRRSSGSRRFHTKKSVRFSGIEAGDHGTLIRSLERLRERVNTTETEFIADVTSQVDESVGDISDFEAAMSAGDNSGASVEISQEVGDIGDFLAGMG